MKKLLIICAVVLFIAGFSSKVSAQVTKSNTAGGEILAPITLTVEAPLEFGKLAVLAAGGTVTLTAEATPNVSSDIGVTLVTGVTRTAAKYTVGGTATYNYSITAPATITVTRVSGTETMDIATAVKSISTGSSTGGTLNSGSDIFYLGGILTIKPNQAPGTYTTNFDVKVNYN